MKKVLSFLLIWLLTLGTYSPVYIILISSASASSLNLPAMNLTSLEDFKEKSEEAIKSKLPCISYRNEHIFQSLVNMRYLFSESPTHMVAAEEYILGYRVDGVFLPIIGKGSNEAIIHEYKYPDQNHRRAHDKYKDEYLYKDKAGKIQDVDALSNNALWQIYENNYMAIPIAANDNKAPKFVKEAEKINSIIIRPIVFYDLANGEILTKIKQIKHPIDAAQQVVEFFSSATVKTLLEFNEDKRDLLRSRKTFLEKIGYKYPANNPRAEVWQEKSLIAWLKETPFSIGKAYSSLGDDHKAFGIYTLIAKENPKALEEMEKIARRTKASDMQRELGDIYFGKEQWTDAESWYKLAFTQNEREVNDKLGQAYEKLAVILENRWKMNKCNSSLLQKIPSLVKDALFYYQEGNAKTQLNKLLDEIESSLDAELENEAKKLVGSVKNIGNDKIEKLYVAVNGYREIFDYDVNSLARKVAGIGKGKAKWILDKKKEFQRHQDSYKARKEELASYKTE